MATITAYTPIPDGAQAIPSLWNSRLSLLQQDLVSVNSDVAVSDASLTGWDRGSITTDALINSSNSLKLAGPSETVFIDNPSSSLRLAGQNAAGLAVSSTGTVGLLQSRTPSAGNASGTLGDISWDADYIYIYTSTLSWGRIPIQRF